MTEWQLKQGMEKAGFTEIAAVLAAHSLWRKGFVTFREATDHDAREEYTLCKITDAGVDWLLAKMNSLNLQITQVTEDAPPANDIPF